MDSLRHYATDLAATLGHCILLFATRHWLLAIVSIAFTVLLSLGVLNFARRFFALPTETYLQWTRIIYLCALFKGAFYLVLGDNRPETFCIVGGIQMPDPVELLCLVPQTKDSIWQPTEAMYLVSAIMGTVALYLLGMRAYRVLLASRALSGVAHLSGAPEPRITTCLLRAAEALGFAPNATLPTLLLVDLDCSTPLLLGVFRPSLLLSPSLAAYLSDGELEALFRHELAHLKRRDHWWRWLMLWVQDVGRLNPLSAYLAAEAVAIEEQLCDRMAVRTASEALHLANAIVQAKEAVAANLPSKSQKPEISELSLPRDVVPAFLGNFGTPTFEAESLSKRMATLVTLAKELNASAEADRVPSTRSRGSLSPNSKRKKVGLFFVKLVIFLVIYLKFIFVLNPTSSW